MTDDIETREAYCAGLEQLASILRANPDTPLPTTGDSPYGPISWYLFGSTSSMDHDAQKTVAGQIIRVLPGVKTKEETGDLFRFTGQLHGLHFSVIVDRPAVCERVVTGIETVSKRVPDPEKLASVPLIDVTEDVETVEWRCAPLLESVES